MLQTSSDSTHGEIKGATSSSYMLSVEDIGFFISLSCEPIRSDGAHGPIVLSEQVGPIIPGISILLSCLGKCLLLNILLTFFVFTLTYTFRSLC